jgi:hypothetical protein
VVLLGAVTPLLMPEIAILRRDDLAIPPVGAGALAIVEQRVNSGRADAEGPVKDDRHAALGGQPQPRGLRCCC